MITLNVPSTILARSESAPRRLGEMVEHFHADHIDPVEYKCLRCGCEWDQPAGYDWRRVTCSNCYSERVIITIVRLGFQNWGEQNGGEAEQRARYEKAEQETEAAMKALGRVPRQL